MRTRTRIAATLTTCALVGGIGLVGAPAQAKTTSTATGSTVISILPSARNEMSVIGVQFQGLEPASLSDAGDGLALTLPVSGAPKRGIVVHAGVMTIASSLNRIDLSVPQLEYVTKAGVTTGRITFKDEYDALAGDRVAFFDVTDVSITVKKGKARKSGSTWKRTDTQLITGTVSISSNADLVNAINAYIGTTYFTPGMEFGTVSSSARIVLTCTTSKECA
jgi:hypothetical protein